MMQNANFPKPLNPKPLNPKPLNPKPLNPKPLNPKPFLRIELWSSGDGGPKNLGARSGASREKAFPRDPNGVFPKLGFRL